MGVGLLDEPTVGGVLPIWVLRQAHLPHSQVGRVESDVLEKE